MLLNYRHAIYLGDYIEATVPIAADDSRVSFTDYEGTLARDSAKSRITRTIVLSGFEHCAPGARARFKVTVTQRSQVIVKTNYTGLVTRLDTYNDIGSVFVDGAFYVDFSNPAGHVSGQPHPTGVVETSIIVEPGSHDIEVIFPYCASMDFVGITMPAGGALSSATARVSKKIVYFGDSITHGFNSTKIRLHWPFLHASAEGAQMINVGYGSRGLVNTDATVAAATGADIGISLIGFNVFYPNGGSLATFQSNDEALQANWYAGAPGKPLYIMTPTYSTSDVGEGGTYDGNSPTLEQFRQARRDAVTARADPTTTLIEGATGSMPTGSGNFPDGIHPNDAANITIASAVGAAVT